MLNAFDAVLERKLGFRSESCGSDYGPYLYLDDCLFTGSRVIDDMGDWLSNSAPKGATVHIVLIALHRSGWWRARRDLDSLTGGDVSVNWWKGVEVEDRKSHINQSAVLRPIKLPKDPLAVAYEQELIEAGFPPIFRQPTGVLHNTPFSSESRRQLLEQAFLRAGLYIRAQYRNPRTVMRPLGFMALTTLGFGALTITYRNCANNCPLALWWGDTQASPDEPFGRWYPLFPRRTNEMLSILTGLNPTED